MKEKLVTIIEPVFIKLLKSDNPLLPFQWNINNTGLVNGAIPGADMRINGTRCITTGAGTRVAVIDDGVDLTHPDLQANLLLGFDATGNNSGGAPTTNNSHGTSCAGVIAMVNNTIGGIGIAFNTQIIPIRLGITDQITGVYNTNNTWIANCFNEAVARGADVISNSWGGGSQSAQIDAAIQNAVINGRGGRGCVVLFSSGNNNNSVSYPATNTNVIAVGASTPCDTRKRSSNNPAFVNQGVSTDPEGTSCDGENWWGSNFGTGLDLISPGVIIPTTDNVGANGRLPGDYNEVFNGTSAACPNAAGVVALIFSANPNLTGSQARFILESTCDKIGSYVYQTNVTGQPNGTWSNQAGYGRINAETALRQIIGQNLSINGPALICNTADYSIPNLPSGATVVWSVPSNVGPVLQLAQNTPTTNQLRITNNRWYGVSTTLTATITISCNSVPLTATKTIANDNDNSSTQYGSYNQAACTFYNVYHPSQSGTLNGNSIFLHQGCMTTVSLYNMNGRTLSLSGGGTPLFWSYTPAPNTNYATGSLYLQLPYGSGGVPFIFNITANGACYSSKSLVFFAYSNNARYAFSVSPNPVSDVLTITAVENDEATIAQNSKLLNTDVTITANITELNTNQLMLTKKMMSSNKTYQINVSSLRKGYHVLQIIEGDQTHTIKFLKL